MSLYNDASLVMIPSAYKDGKLYSIKPTDGSGDFTFSRGSNLAATRVDENGLIEKGRENLLLQSNSFDTTWVADGVNLTSGQSGYDGSSDAWKLVPIAVTGNHNISQGFSVSGIRTISIYAKPSGYNYMLIYSSGYGGTFFDLVNGTTTNNIGTTPIDNTITSVGNGWYRCSIVVSSGSDVSIWPSPDGINYIYSGDGTSGILIQDAQLEVGLVATDYIETTTTTAQAGILEDMPRLDYSGGASCPSLLLEPQRTNLLTQSEYFGGWTTGISGTGVSVSVTDNYATSPEGLSNAARLQMNKGAGAGSSDYAFIQQTFASAGTGSNSIYMKSNDGNIYDVALRNVNYEVKSVGSEWTRFTLENQAALQAFQLILRGGYGTDDSIDILIYGAQSEVGSYPTSYIPCYGAATTRLQDLTTADTSSFYTDSSSGTLFSELSFPLAADGNYNGWFFWNGSSYHRIVLQRRGDTGKGQVEVRINNTTQASIISSSAITLEDNHKMLVRWDNNQFTFFIDGVNIGSDTSTDSYSGTNLNELASRPTYNAANIKQAVLFPTALTDSECIALTTI